MEERFGQNRFERLAQGNNAKILQIESARASLVTTEIPESLFRSHERTTRLAVLPLLAVIFAAACSGGASGDKFSEDLPPELFDACRAFVGADTVGGPSDKRGFSIAFNFLAANITDSDSRMSYMAAAGELFTANYSGARFGFDISIDEGLPQSQAEIAQDVIDSIDNFIGSGDVDTIEPLFEAMADVRSNMEAEICPEGAERPEESESDSAPDVTISYNDLLDGLLTDGGSGYSISVASLLEEYEYQHISEVQEVVRSIKDSTLTLQDNKESLSASFLQPYTLTIPAKYMIENHENGVTTDSLNGAQVLLDALQDDNYPLITNILAPEDIRGKLIYFLGDEEGEEIFGQLGDVITSNLDLEQGQYLWDRLTPEDRLLLE